MFYSNYDNYMQDLYYYNQQPNNRYNTYSSCGTNSYNSYNPGMTNNGYSPYMNNNYYNPYMNNSYMQSTSTNQNMQTESFTNMYPSIYRIINPVVSRVVSGSNYQYLTEDNLNNMVDTVYNIVEGQVDLGDDDYSETSTESKSVTTNSPSQTSRSTTSERSSNQNTTSNNSAYNSNPNYARKSRRANELLRDLIKILVIKEILSRQNTLNQSYSTQNPYLYSQMMYPSFA